MTRQTALTGEGHEGGQASETRRAMRDAVLCEHCGLKFSAVGFRLHRVDGVCVPEEELQACLGMFCWDRERSPRWYSRHPGADRQARERLVSALEGGQVTAWQLRAVRLWPDRSETLLDLVRMLVRRNRAALELSGIDGNGP